MGSVGKMPLHVPIPVTVLQARRLSPAARLVYMQLLLQARTGQGEGVADFRQLEEVLGVSQTNLDTSWNELEDNGLLETLRAEGTGRHYLLVPLDEVDWPLVGAVGGKQRAVPVAAAVAVAAAGRSDSPTGDTPATVGPGMGATGATVAVVGAGGTGAASGPRTVTPATKPSWVGVPDRMLTLQQKVQKYQLEKVLAYVYQRIGQDFTPQMADMVVGWAEEDSFHFPPAVIKAVIDECIRRDKLHPHYMQKVAENWYKQGIRTAGQVAEITRRSNERLRRYRLITRRLNLSRKLTEDEMALCDKWAEEWQFSDELILAACGETVRTSSPSFAYIDAVLQDWRNQNVRTVADVEARRAANAGRKAPDGSEVPATNPRGPRVASARTQVAAAAAAADERRRPQDYWGAYYRLVGREGEVMTGHDSSFLPSLPNEGDDVAPGSPAVDAGDEEEVGSVDVDGKLGSR